MDPSTSRRRTYGVQPVPRERTFLDWFEPTCIDWRGVISANIAYVGAIAALAGVLVSTISQLIAGRVQRRHDRTTKLLDIKLELYSKTFILLNLMKKTMDAIPAAADELKEAATEREQMARERDEIINLITEFREAYALPDGTFPTDLPDDVRREAKHRLEQFREYESELGSRQAKLETQQGKLRDRKRELDELQNVLSKAGKKFRKISSSLLLLTEETAGHRLSLIADGLSIRHTLNASDIDAFQRAIRRELGVPRTPVRRLLNTIKRKFRARRLRLAAERR